MWLSDLLALHRRSLFVALVFAYLSKQTTSQKSSASTTTTPIDAPTATCEFKTINYITHTLPQQCFRTSWPGDAGKSDGPTKSQDSTQLSSIDNRTATTSGTGWASLTADGQAQPSGSNIPTISLSDPTAETDAESAPRPFVSFEDWKEMMLRKAGQDPSDLKSRKTSDRSIEHERVTKSSGFDSLGDDGEIDLNFDVVSEKISIIASSPQSTKTEAASTDQLEQQHEPVLYDDGRTQYSRSKDAGKTCKERFSYSSFDAGATVLKTNPGVKNAKAILVENKDSYMLFECSAQNKFVIVELSDDILIDTVVLANFEFFSSMIRQFRVSVSDRYPVKPDKWKDLGTFEAKNSRDIQPFLVQNPLIWAKYVRIEFLTHYGNEYYCPVSLLRVHGTRMLESLKDAEIAAEEEYGSEEPAGELPGPVGDSHSAPGIREPENTTGAPIAEAARYAVIDTSIDPLLPDFIFSAIDGGNVTCLTSAASAFSTSPKLPRPDVHEGTRSGLQHSQSIPNNPVSKVPVDKSASSPTTESKQSEDSTVSPLASSALAGDHQININSDARLGSGEDTTGGNPPVKTPLQATTQPRVSSNSTAIPNSPTVQESFFKTMSKRLSQLESNLTWSMRYMEDQSRLLQEAQQLEERRQGAKVDAFLNVLNTSVFTELRLVRQQYDEVWQSTVLALENQKEQSARETLALSSRLNILADEVVFQKRMAIVQAILLLSCLILVIFSRATTQPISIGGTFDLGRSPSLNHSSRGLPAGHESGGVYTPRFGNDDQPFSGGGFDEVNRSDLSSGVPRPSAAIHPRLLTPSSDISHDRYALESSRCGLDPMMATIETLLGALTFVLRTRNFRQGPHQKEIAN
ncbi:Uncharacterized protein slp1 [Colletotrichum chlorophyti]|uniref:Uncharacterized protein slp1 n=1 Tax=Colletotrichum chlorophyti TaxID=708187 RepID=A0A1Q8RB13_9PEZI|nr:Uncharacterized protein slp1 [Colletotrichum chlorophyti]